MRTSDKVLREFQQELGRIIVGRKDEKKVFAIINLLLKKHPELVEAFKRDIAEGVGEIKNLIQEVLNKFGET